VQSNPAKRNRRSIRLKGYDYAASGAYFITICTHHRERLFGEIIDGEMRLNPLGQLIDASWQRLSLHFPNLILDAFVVMPNHIHGILVLTRSGRGAALDQNLELVTDDSHANATPNPDHNFDRNTTPNPTNHCELGVALGQGTVNSNSNQLPNAAPLRPRLVSGSVGAIVLNFKSVTTRSINRIRKSPGCPVWQRNYYEHIIRNEASWQLIREYIDNNPRSWQEDQLHPNNPSKW